MHLGITDVLTRLALSGGTLTRNVPLMCQPPDYKASYCFEMFKSTAHFRCQYLSELKQVYPSFPIANGKKTISRKAQYVQAFDG